VEINARQAFVNISTKHNKNPDMPVCIKKSSCKHRGRNNPILFKKSMKYLLALVIFFSAGPLRAQLKDAHYQQALEHRDNKEYRKGLEQIAFCLAKDSVNTDYLMVKAYCLFKLEEVRDAYNAYTRVLHLEPSNAQAYNDRGLLLSAIQQFEAAITDMNEALQLEKNDTLKNMILLNRATVKQGYRDFQGAYDDLIKVYAFDTLNTATLNNLAAVCDEVGKGDQTLQYLFKIIAIDSGFIGSYVNIGFKYQEMGEYKKAITYFDKALGLDANEPLSYNNRAYNKLQLKDYKGALADVETSIRLYPANSYAYRNRALIYIALNQPYKACTDLNRALELGFEKMYGDEVSKLKFKYCHQQSQ
jgi:tetratricopeptide (TPR) repeat protein